MKTIKKTTLGTFLIFVLIFSYNCSGPRVKILDNAVRIKPAKWSEYDTINVNGRLEPRNGSALRGTVYKIEDWVRDCPDSADYGKAFKSYVVFKDTLPDAPIERIPLEDVDLVGLKKSVNLGRNWFEIYNNPLNPSLIAEVPIDTVLVGCDTTVKCPCEPIGFGCENAECYPPFKFKKKEFYLFVSRRMKKKLAKKSYFVDLKLAAAYFANLSLEGIKFVDKAFTYEFAAGFRFGFRKQYALGLSFFGGVPLANIYLPGKISKSARAFAAIYARETFDEFCCAFPYVYGQLGLVPDKPTIELFKLNTFCGDCARRLGIERGLPPLSFGFGAGIDIPINCELAISIDAGYKSLVFGEFYYYPIGGFNVPIQRRKDLFLLRAGVSF